MFSIIRYQRSITTLLLYFLPLLQGCRSQLSISEEEVDIPCGSEAQQGGLSGASTLAQPIFPPTYQAATPCIDSGSQEWLSFVDISPLRATKAKHQQQTPALPKSPGLYVQQVQEDEDPPIKRQRIADGALTSLDIAENPTKRLREIFANHAMVDDGPYYVERPQETEKLRETLARQSTCVLYGPGGSGKSALACHYAYSTGQQIVWFVPADSPDKTQAALQSVAQKLGVDCKALFKTWEPNLRRYYQALCQTIYDLMTEYGQDLLLILDNAPANELAADFIPLRSVHRVRTIITTRNLRGFPYHEKVKLSGFLPQEGIAYVEQRLRPIQGRFAKKDTIGLPVAAKYILKTVGTTPLKLDLAIGFLYQNSARTVEDYIEELQVFKDASDTLLRPGVMPEVDMGLASLDKLPQQVIRYSVSLDVDFIPLSLLSMLLEESEESIRNILAPLERISLVTILAEGTGIKIHRSVKESCRYYFQWNTGDNLNEKALANRLIQVLFDVMPCVEPWPDARWETGRLYAPHVSQVLAKATEIFDTHPVMVSLLDLMANYQKEVAYDYPQALFYLKHALTARQKLYGEFPHPDVAKSLNDIGVVYKALGNVQKGLAYLNEALTMRYKLYGKALHPDVANSLHNVGMAYDSLGDSRKALNHLERALTIRRTFYKKLQHPDVARSLNSVGCVYQKLGDAQRGLTYQEQALTMQQYLYGDTLHPDLVDSLHNVGLAYQKLGDIQKSIPYLEQVLTMRQKLYREVPHSDVIRSLNNLGMAHQKLGNASRSLTYKVQALAVLQALHKGSPHPDVASSLYSVGTTYKKLGMLEKSLTYLKRALKMRQKIYIESPHPDVARSLNSISVAYESMGELQKSLVYQERTLAAFKAIYGEKPHFHVASSLNNVGLAHQMLGQLQRALPYLKQSLAMFQALHTELPNPRVANSLNNVGVAYGKLGELQKGLQYLVQALTMRRALHIRLPHPDVTSSLHNVGLAYKKLGDLQRAKQYFEEGLAFSQWLDTATATLYSQKFKRRLRALHDA